ncbi:hypothetical protein [Bauldia sp.]|uniref:hypothetical protein n=1 Tax=Bauldia sp. TaxID=2575872 RepID=UPI003BA948E3
MARTARPNKHVNVQPDGLPRLKLADPVDPGLQQIGPKDVGVGAPTAVDGSRTAIVLITDPLTVEDIVAGVVLQETTAAEALEPPAVRSTNGRIVAERLLEDREATTPGQDIEQHGNASIHVIETEENIVILAKLDAINAAFLKSAVLSVLKAASPDDDENVVAEIEFVSLAS